MTSGGFCKVTAAFSILLSLCLLSNVPNFLFAILLAIPFLFLTCEILFSRVFFFFSTISFFSTLPFLRSGNAHTPASFSFSYNDYDWFSEQRVAQDSGLQGVQVDHGRCRLFPRCDYWLGRVHFRTTVTTFGESRPLVDFFRPVEITDHRCDHLWGYAQRQLVGCHQSQCQ